MDLQNEASLPVAMYRAQLHYRDLVMTTLIVKASYEVAPDGSTSPVDDPLPIYEADVATPLGVLEGDVVPIKDGCDFAIYGGCTSARGPVGAVDVVARVGDFERALRVTGDRVWVAKDQGLEMSQPVPFTQMELTYDRAFGGAAVQGDDELSAPDPENPGGRGWIALSRYAPGTPLPNVEEIDQRVTRWDQRAMPGGLLPLPRGSYLRGSRGVVVDLEERTTSLEPRAFMWSHPRMLLPEYPAGRALTIRGMTTEPEWRVRLPDPDLVATVALGERSHRLRLVPDTLCVVPSHRRLWVVLRRAFVYQLVPRRKRRVTVGPCEAGEKTDTPTTTIARESAAANPDVPVLPPDDPERMPLPWHMLRSNHPLTSIIESLPLCASG